MEIQTNYSQNNKNITFSGYAAFCKKAYSEVFGLTKDALPSGIKIIKTNTRDINTVSYDAYLAVNGRELKQINEMQTSINRLNRIKTRYPRIAKILNIDDDKILIKQKSIDKYQQRLMNRYFAAFDSYKTDINDVSDIQNAIRTDNEIQTLLDHSEKVQTNIRQSQEFISLFKK